jgi:hypothetical protein
VSDPYDTEGVLQGNRAALLRTSVGFMIPRTHCVAQTRTKRLCCESHDHARRIRHKPSGIPALRTRCIRLSKHEIYVNNTQEICSCPTVQRIYMAAVCRPVCPVQWVSSCQPVLMWVQEFWPQCHAAHPL